MAILMSDKVDIRAMNSTRDKVYFIINFYQYHIIILNVYVPNKSNLKYIKQREIDKPTTKDISINTLFSIINRTIERKTSKDIKDLNKTTHQHDLINISRPPHWRIATYTF